MQQSEGVKEAMLRFYDRFSAYDVGSFDRLVSQKRESMVIGTAPDEWFDDREQWRSAFEMEGLRLEAGVALRSYQEGSVGRVTDQSTFVFPDGATIPTRLAAVMREEDGKWRLVQARFSVGVPDEEVAI